MAAIKPAPIACTLSPAEFQNRSVWIERLTNEALITHHINDGTAHLFYRADAKELVEQLVRQEQACCGFLHFEMAEHPSGIAVTITASEEARADAAALFAHFIPSRPAQSESAARDQNRCGCVTPCGS